MLRVILSLLTIAASSKKEISSKSKSNTQNQQNVTNSNVSNGDKTQKPTIANYTLGLDGQKLSDDDEDFGEKVDSENEDDDFFYDKRKNPHPRSPTSKATKQLILAFKKPDEKSLNECISKFRIAAETASNADTMVQTMMAMTAAVSDDVKFHHWCFYYFMSALDWKLEEDSRGMRLQERQTIFTQNSKGLWLLARSLDEAVNSHIYFDFVKVRYVDLSLKYFGRSIDVVSPPLGNRLWIESAKNLPTLDNLSH